jgi:hypothetical protein
MPDADERFFRNNKDGLSKVKRVITTNFAAMMLTHNTLDKWTRETKCYFGKACLSIWESFRAVIPKLLTIYYTLIMMHKYLFMEVSCNCTFTK